jgi:hypothetical protein
LHHALKFLPKGTGIFAIFTDIISNISNFVPVAHLDLSKRVADSGFLLFEPFYLLDTIDIYADLKMKLTLEETGNLQHFFRYGRLLWGALSQSNDTSSFVLYRIIALAIDKLVSGKSFIHWKKTKNISIVETLAILGSRLCIDITPQSEYASQLMAGYMRLCLYILEDRESIITSMPSEPVLAEASARIMNDPNVNLTQLIN